MTSVASNKHQDGNVAFRVALNGALDLTRGSDLLSYFIVANTGPRYSIL